jgi:DNA-binding transcriptional MerR regulator
MQYFTIKDIENLCGIRAHTLRIWEQRYRFFTPKRKESSHRIYDNDDLKQLLRIAFLYHNGWKISRINTLNTEGILTEVRKAGITGSNYKVHIMQLIEAAVDFNQTFFVDILETMIQKIGFEKCMVEVCYPFLQKIGMLWVTNKVIPAQEHFSSYLIQNKIIAETDKLAPANTAPELILFSPQEEYHELPLLYIYYLLKKNGWSILYLGSNIRKKSLKQFLSPTVKYLFFHLITNFTGMDANNYLEDLCHTFSNKTIIATGSAVHPVQKTIINLKLLRTDKEIYDFIELQDR